MTDIRELLRAATEDLPVDRADPVGLVRRATTRRRRKLAAVGGVVVAVVVAIVIPLSLSTGSDSTSVVSPSPPSITHAGGTFVETWKADDGEVAAGFGSIWGIPCCGGDSGPSYVDRLDPTTGRVLTHIVVPGPTTTVAAGAGYVWTIGATDGGSSAISAIDPVNSRVTTMRLTNPKAEPYNIAFLHGSAWVTMQLLNQVWRLTATGSGISKSVIPVSGGPTGIATSGDGALWVQRESKQLSRIVPTAAGGRLGLTVQWPGDIYSPDGRTGGALWASFGAHTVLALSPADLAGCQACAQADNIIVKGHQIYTAISTSRGLFVSTFGGPSSPGRTDFFSSRALNESRETPTAHVAAGGPLAPDGNGIVIGAGRAGLVHWVPAR